ncbi:MAG TPA: hypothetical protein VIJ95_05145 [Hanamia sp.]
MPKITLQSRLLIDNKTHDKKFLSLIQYAFESFNDTFGIPSTYKSKSWDYLRMSNAEIVKSVNKQLTNDAPGYLRSYKHLLKDLSGRHTIEFAEIEAEIFETRSIENIDELKLAIYFLSKPYNLIGNFGSYILIAEGDNQVNGKTVMLELSHNLTINSYL